MPTTIGRDEVRHLVSENDAQVVEVLPRPEYDWAHLPGATHLALRQFSAEAATTMLTPDRQVVVYCHDYQ
ncbi:MAG: rhodanese-like domain-containing protein [Actinomycetota bacterium]|nr:rhodanese-like domain-containing protein [Actinomycetota bacterium]